MIRVYRPEQAEQWDAVVRSFRAYDAYWLSGYVKAFMIHGDGEPLLILYEDSDTRGINVVMKRDVAKDATFAGSVPDGMYYELTYNGDKHEWYLDAYKKFENRCIPDRD